MNNKFLLSSAVFLILIVTSCKKQLAGIQGEQGLKSLINVESVSTSTSCPAGGVIIKSGIDKNINDILDSTEVEKTNYVCNGENGNNAASDKQIVIPINFSANTTSTTPVVGGEVLKFDKENYPGVDSVILVSNPYVGDKANTVIVNLYNITDNIVINNSTLSTSNLYTNRSYLQTGNLYKELPDHEVTIGISLKSGIQNKFAAAGSAYMFLFRK